jgi:hypothetical protein
MSDDEDLPTPEAANNAVQVVVTGKRSRARVNVTTAHASAPQSTATTTSSETAPPETGFWTRSRRIGAFVAGAATVVAAVIAVIEFV